MCTREHCFLPPFCHFTPEEWKTKGHEYNEVRDCMLGWDITDYGLGDFDKVGMSLITIRNGNRAMQDKYPKVYAEKLLYMKEGQYSPKDVYKRQEQHLLSQQNERRLRHRTRTRQHGRLQPFWADAAARNDDRQLPHLFPAA